MARKANVYEYFCQLVIFYHATSKKTFLNMRLRFNSADDCEVFRILRLDATDLEIEYHRGWGIAATMYL